jgi:hypothetical protein
MAVKMVANTKAVSAERPASETKMGSIDKSITDIVLPSVIPHITRQTAS